MEHLKQEAPDISKHCSGKFANKHDWQAASSASVDKSEQVFIHPSSSVSSKSWIRDAQVSANCSRYGDELHG